MNTETWTASLRITVGPLTCQVHEVRCGTRTHTYPVVASYHVSTS